MPAALLVVLLAAPAPGLDTARSETLTGAQRALDAREGVFEALRGAGTNERAR